jgi:hypothetical protein
MGEAVQHLYDELDRLGATNIVVSSDMRVRLDGRPYADQKKLEEPGVAVYFTLNGRQQCIPCDKWDSVKDNVRAIGLTVEALRGLDRWGAKEMVDAAFSGFTALPAGGASASENWWDVLGVDPDATRDKVRSAYLKLAQEMHPDTGGSEAAMLRLNKAYQEGMAM